jgi:hypothetical protein
MQGKELDTCGLEYKNANFNQHTFLHCVANTATKSDKFTFILYFNGYQRNVFCFTLLLLYLHHFTPRTYNTQLSMTFQSLAYTRQGCDTFHTSGPRTSHRNLQRSLDWTGRACGFASQITGPHTIGLLPMGLHKTIDLLIAS